MLKIRNIYIIPSLLELLTEQNINEAKKMENFITRLKQSGKFGDWGDLV